MIPLHSAALKRPFLVRASDREKGDISPSMNSLEGARSRNGRSLSVFLYTAACSIVGLGTDVILSGVATRG